MKRQSLLIVLGLLLLLAPAGAFSLAQETAPTESVAGETALAAVVGEKISYQGYLEQAGTPLEGTVNLTFRLYSNSACSTLVDTIVKNSVPVSGGYFSTELEVDQADFNGQGLWIGAAVGGSDLGCQEIMPAPYALSLRPGAQIQGGLISGEAFVTAISTNGTYKASLLKSGLGVASVYGYNAGGGMAVFGEASGALATGVLGTSDTVGGYGGYFKNSIEGGVALKVAGSGIIESNADTRVAVNAFKIVSESGSDVETIMGRFGYAVLRASNTGVDYVLLPVDVPMSLFGTPLRIRSVRICYKTEQAGDYITSTSVRSMGDSSYSTHLFNSTNHSSSSGECYTIYDDTPDVITGPVYLRFGLYYGGTGTQHDIHIGKVVLTLVEWE